MRLRSIALVFAALVAAPSFAADLAAQRRQFELAHRAAAHVPGDGWRALARGLEDYPLWPYLEYAALSRRLDAAGAKTVAAFLERHRGTLVADLLRARWLDLLARDERWAEYLRFHVASESIERRCAQASARAVLGRTKGLLDEARALYRSPHSLPKACDPMLAWLERQPAFGPKLVWERLELAAAARDAALVRALARKLGAQRAEGERWADAIASPSVALGTATRWPDDARHRRLAAIAVAQLARADEERAAALWPALERHFRFDASQRHLALDAIALYQAADYQPGAEQWIAKVPVDARSDELREWSVREALGRRDWAAAARALDALTHEQRNEPRWRWVRARVLEQSGKAPAAAAIVEALARESGYYGFLASERLGAPYTICPRDPGTSAAAVEAVAKEPALARAFELHALGRLADARREWDHALVEAPDPKRHAAVQAALARGWIDRGPLTLLKPGDARLYEWRFPIAHAREIRAAAKRHRLDPALVLALIRSESAWMTDARSGANAHGLMQLIPEAAKPLARREQIAWRGVSQLYDPAINIRLGTHHLKNDLARYDGKAWLAAAAYNAGATPVRRWIAARGGLPADLFVETIPYRETREYVARVIAFSVIYDWRLHGDAGSITNRIAVVSKSAGRRAVACPAPQLAGPA